MPERKIAFNLLRYDATTSLKVPFRIITFATFEDLEKKGNLNL